MLITNPDIAKMITEMFKRLLIKWSSRNHQRRTITNRFAKRGQKLGNFVYLTYRKPL